MYRYEMHVHTFPVSACGHADVKETLEYYKNLGYDGVFITNHFLDGNIGIDYSESYENKINFYFSDYEKGLTIGKEIGIKVFLGIEISYKGTDFLIYGLNKDWFLQHPEIMDMKMSDKLSTMRKNGAFLAQAHPYREANYIDHIRLFPRSVDSVEVVNACRTNLENEMAHIYAKSYGLLEMAGSDNHFGKSQTKLAGMESKTPLNSVEDFINGMKNGTLKIFELND